jgi:hypothetical protein
LEKYLGCLSPEDKSGAASLGNGRTRDGKGEV